MDAAAKIDRNPVSKRTKFSLSVKNEQADAGRDGRTHLARPNSQARTGTGEYCFSLFSLHEQDWQPYPVDPYSATVYVMTLYTYEYRASTSPTQVLHYNFSFHTRSCGLHSSRGKTKLDTRSSTSSLVVGPASTTFVLSKFNLEICWLSKFWKV